MSDSLEFFDIVENIHPFSDSDFTEEDIPESELERAVLLSFLTRHYVPLEEDDLSEYLSGRHDINANSRDIDNALKSLSSEALLREKNDKYTLNNENELVQVIQDARIEYVLNSDYS